MNRSARKIEYVKPELAVQELSLALYQANKKLKISNEELLLSKKELTEVFANISHDLRSPITAIRNSLEYILSMDSLEGEDVLSVIHLMYRRVDYLEQLISDIFILSAIDSSHKIFCFDTVNIGMFLEDFYFSCDADRKYAKRQLSLKVPESFPFMVSIDCKMMLRVLDNLFTNAFNYSEDQACVILSAEYNEKNTILISVTDTGYGIAGEHLSKIFDRTYKVESARTPGQSSSCGLG
ncbi:MAG: sensor histidine kinase, partial [Mobilitalea sp.]